VIEEPLDHVEMMVKTEPQVLTVTRVLKVHKDLQERKDNKGDRVDLVPMAHVVLLVHQEKPEVTVQSESQDQAVLLENQEQQV